MDLNLIAINNIQVLSEFNKKDNFLNCKNKIFLESVQKDDHFEDVTELVDIEYALYFSFHHLINIPSRFIIEDYSRKDILNLMIDAITNIYDIYEISMFEEENVRIYQMMENIDEIIFNATINYKQNKCYFKMLDMFDYMCSGFKVFHELSVNFHSQISGFNFNSDSDDNDNDDNDSDDNGSDNNDSDDNDSDDNDNDNDSDDNDSDDNDNDSDDNESDNESNSSNESNKRRKLE